MSITAATFKSRFPVFATVDDADIEMFIEISNAQVSEDDLGLNYNEGLHLLTAHLLVIHQKAESGNTRSVVPLSSYTVGDVSEVYAAGSTGSVGSSGSGTSPFYHGSVYGQQYYRLLYSAVRAFGVA